MKIAICWTGSRGWPLKRSWTGPCWTGVGPYHTPRLNRDPWSNDVVLGQDFTVSSTSCSIPFLPSTPGDQDLENSKLLFYFISSFILLYCAVIIFKFSMFFKKIDLLLKSSWFVIKFYNDEIFIKKNCS